jgi:hypothetical protein
MMELFETGRMRLEKEINRCYMQLGVYTALVLTVFALTVYMFWQLGWILLRYRDLKRESERRGI